MPAAIRVLVVDDEDNIAFLVASALRLEGLERILDARKKRGLADKPSREVYSRRTGEIADAVASTPLLVSDRLGQAYSRAPRPTTRRGEDN